MLFKFSPLTSSPSGREALLRGLALSFLGATFFVLPFSTALSQIFSWLALATLLFLVRIEKALTILRSRTFTLTLLLWLYLMLSAFWSTGANYEICEAILKYRKLLLAMLMVHLFLEINDSPIYLVKAFMASVMLCASFSILSYSGVFQWVFGSPNYENGWALFYQGKPMFTVGGPENPVFGRNHITQGVFMSVALSYSIESIIKNKRVDKFSSSHILIFLPPILLATAILTLQGRTGYLLLTLVIIFSGWRLFASTGRNGKIFIILLICMVFMVSPARRNFERILIAKDDAISFFKHGGTEGSQGQRLNFWSSGLSIFMTSPVFGSGVGSYSAEYVKENKRSLKDDPKEGQAHSDFVMIAVQGGAVGLLFYTLLLVSTWTALSRSRAPEMKLPFSLLIVGSSFNSLLWDSAEGLLISLIFAIASVGEVNKKI